MDVKRLTRGPAIWVIVFVVLLLVGARVFAPNQYRQVDTSEAIQLIENGDVKSAKIIDRDQRLELTLSTSFQGYTRVQTYYVAPRGSEIVTLLNQHKPPQGFTDEVPSTSWWSGLLFAVLPVLLILGVFWFMMGQMQGGGSRVMNFGKSRAKLVSKDTPKVTFADVAGAAEIGRAHV